MTTFQPQVWENRLVANHLKLPTYLSSVWGAYRRGPGANCRVSTDLYKVCVYDNSLPGLKNSVSGLTLLLNSGATDIVFVTLFRTAVGTVIAWFCRIQAIPPGLTGYITDRMRDFNFRGLSLELRLLLLAPLFQLSVGKTTATSTTDDLPHPWLTENRAATVLELVCKPSSTIRWDKIYGLKLRFSRLVKPVVTLASVTTATGIPHREKVPDIARVSFNGNWDNPSLSVRMPLTSEDFGEYSCSGQYKEKGRTGGTAFPYFNTSISVNASRSQSHNVHHFEVRVTEAHEVNVTWSPPKESKLIQASVSSTMVDKDGKDIAAGRSLVTTNGSKTFVYTSKVLLEEFRKPNGDVGNFSVRLYVDSALCDPYCRYSCHVPYTGCYGRDAQFCVCSQEGVSHNQDSVPESTQSTDLESTTERQGQDPVPESTEFIAVLTLFILSVIVHVFVLCYYLFKTGKCQIRRTHLNRESVTSPADKVQLADQNSRYSDNSESPTSGTGTHPQERPDDASEQNRPPAGSAQNDKPQSSTPPSEGIRPSHAEEKAGTRYNVQTTVALPYPAASSGDNNPTPNDDESGAERGASFTSLQPAGHSEDEHETKDSSPSGDHHRTEAEAVPDTHSNPEQSKGDTEGDEEVTPSETRRPKATVRAPYGLHSSVTASDELQTPLLEPSTSQRQTPA